MNEAIITLIEYEGGIPYTKVYRVEYEGSAMIVLHEDEPDLASSNTNDTIAISVRKHIATEQLRA